MKQTVIAISLAVSVPSFAVANDANETQGSLIRLFLGTFAPQYCRPAENGQLKVEVDNPDEEGTKKIESYGSCFARLPVVRRLFEFACAAVSKTKLVLTDPEIQSTGADVFLSESVKNRGEGIKALLGHEIEKPSPHKKRQVTFTRFDSDGIEAVFKKLYVAPGETRAGFALQVLYDVVFKETVRNLARALRAIVANEGFLERAGRAYEKALAAAEKEEETSFNGARFVRKLAKQLADKTVNVTAVGSILRRHMDGSLPAFKRILKKVLGDFDSEMSREVGL